MSKKLFIFIFFILMGMAGTLLLLHGVKNRQSNMQHTTYVTLGPYKPFDQIRQYFGTIGYAGTMSPRQFTFANFGGGILNNIHRIRFDLPGSEGYENEPRLQYYHPQG